MFLTKIIKILETALPFFFLISVLGLKVEFLGFCSLG